MISRQALSWKLLTKNKIGRYNLSMSVAKSVLVPIGNGSEEIESVTIINTLVRSGAVVTVASVEESLQVSVASFFIFTFYFVSISL